jgi:hypothetical protein
MKMSEKIKSVMKKIGLAIVAFTGILLFNRFFPKKDETQSKAEESLGAIKKDVAESKKVTKNLKTTVAEAKEIISQGQEDKEKIVSSSRKKREGKAIEAGFKKKS